MILEAPPVERESGARRPRGRQRRRRWRGQGGEGGGDGHAWRRGQTNTVTRKGAKRGGKLIRGRLTEREGSDGGTLENTDFVAVEDLMCTQTDD